MATHPNGLIKQTPQNEEKQIHNKLAECAGCVVAQNSLEAELIACVLATLTTVAILRNDYATMDPLLGKRPTLEEVYSLATNCT